MSEARGTGHYGGRAGVVAIAFEPSWDLRRLRPHFFPRAASVVFGSRVELRTATTDDHDGTWAGREMPAETEIWTGRLKTTNASWPEASQWVSRKPGKVQRVGQLTKSPYAPAFTQGATFTPRLVFVVERQEVSALGLPAGRVAVRSSRGVQEKKPWKDQPSLSGVIETECVRPFYTGDNVFPYIAGQPFLAVVPCGKSGLLQPGLHQWWERAEELWNKNRSSERLSLVERLDYQATLSKQFPIAPLRVVYNRAGMHVVAAKITDRRALIANGLYWAAVGSLEEADYVCAILNAPVTTELVRPFMSYGKDERDIHKHVWEVPIPLFDANNPTHQRLACLGKVAGEIAANFSRDADLHFAATRRHLRQLLESTAEGTEINELVFEMIG